MPDDFHAWLKARLNESRYAHSVAVADKSAILAKELELSDEAQHQAYTAGLLHDCAKLMPATALIDYCDKHGRIPLSDNDRNSPQILHAIVGSHIVSQELNISDKTILGAIRYHTTGHAGMGIVEQVVYVADKWIGLERFPEALGPLQAILNHLFASSELPEKQRYLHQATAILMQQTVEHLKSKQSSIHPDTLEALAAFSK